VGTPWDSLPKSAAEIGQLLHKMGHFTASMLGTPQHRVSEEAARYRAAPDLFTHCWRTWRSEARVPARACQGGAEKRRTVEESKICAPAIQHRTPKSRAGFHAWRRDVARDVLDIDP
jgi:hypothetical protein